MRRREFITLLGGTAAAWPLATSAQPSGKPPIIGFLGSDALAWRAWTDAFVNRLRTLGWVDGSTAKFEYRWSEGQPERAKQLTAEFVSLKADVIVSAGTSAVAAKQVASDIPIVLLPMTRSVKAWFRAWRDPAFRCRRGPQWVKSVGSTRRTSSRHVRCASDSDRIVTRGSPSLGASSGLLHCSNYLVGEASIWA
jgi:hypothetical protein